MQPLSYSIHWCHDELVAYMLSLRLVFHGYKTSLIMNAMPLMEMVLAINVQSIQYSPKKLPDCSPMLVATAHLSFIACICVGLLLFDSLLLNVNE